MHLPDLIHEIGQRLNLPNLTLQDGVCRLVFDRTLIIDLEDDGAGNLCLHSVLTSLTAPGRDALLAPLLSAHLFGLETDGACFGLHPQTDELYLFRVLPIAALDAATAMDVLERFTHQVENWRRKIEQLGQETRGAVLSAPPASELLRA